MALQFIYSNQDFVTDVSQTGKNGPGAVPSTPTPTRFDSALQAGWRARMEKGLFRYHLGNLQTRILPGQHGFVAQLNVKRGIERRKPQEILSIQQEFNAGQFNFNKINPEEIVFEMIKTTGSPEDQPCRIIVIVNVSPLEFGHCLFVPDPSLCLPQVLTEFAIRVGIESVLLSSDPGFRVGFNSLGAFASVNHLHLHGYYLAHQLKIESVPVQPLVPERGFYRLDEFPACFLFYTEAVNVDEVSRAICQVTDMLVDRDVAHNLFMTRGSSPGDCTHDGKRCSSRTGVRVALWPRISCFGAKEESAINVALCELAGHLSFKNKHDYDHCTEKDVVEIIQRGLLPDEDFLKLEQQLVTHLRGL